MRSLVPVTTIILVSSLLVGCSSAMSSRGNTSVESRLRSAPTDALAFQSDKDFGSGLSQSERGALSAAELRALEFGRAGEKIEWGDDDDDDGVSGSIVVTQPFRVGQSSCRRFSHQLKSRSESQQANGTACRRDGGAWRLVQ